MQKVLFTDLDGTLFWPKHKFRMISKKNVEFLRKFIDTGNRVCLISGRHFKVLEKIIKIVERPLDFIGCNGSFVIVDGKKIKEDTFDNARAKTVIREIQEKYDPMCAMLFTDQVPLVVDKSTAHLSLKIGYPFWSLWQGVLREHYEMNTKLFLRELENGKIFKIMFFIGPNEKAKMRAKVMNKEIRATYDDFEASWSDNVIELTSNGSSKAEAINHYLDYVGVDKDKVIVVGDSGNDVSMFKEFQSGSFCMAHSPNEVKKYANNVVEEVYEIDNYLNENTK